MAAAAKSLARGTITWCPSGAPPASGRAPRGVRCGPPATLSGFNHRASRSHQWPPCLGTKPTILQHSGSSLFGLGLLGERSQTGNGRTFTVRLPARRSAKASAGQSEPYPHFVDEPSSYLPSLFDGDLGAWLPDGFISEVEEGDEQAEPASSPVKTSGGDAREGRVSSGEVASIPALGVNERRLPSEIVIPGGGGPVPVVVQLSEDTLELLNRTQAPPRQSVFMYLASVLTKGASSVLLLGGSAIISVAVSLMVLERAGVLKPLPAGATGSVATQAGGMPKVVIRKTVVRPPWGRGECARYIGHRVLCPAL